MRRPGPRCNPTCSRSGATSSVTVLFITHDLDEAIHLADRIVVLGAHPGRVLEVVEVPVPRPRHPDQYLDPKFLATKKRLEELIHPPSDQPTDDALPMIRMTQVGDDVL